MATAKVKNQETSKTAIVKNISVRDGYSPFIGDDGNWWEWSSQYQCFVDTGISASGSSGGSGTTNYNELKNLPVIGNETIKGDVSATIQGMINKSIPDVSEYVTESELSSKLSKIDQLNIPEWAMEKTKPSYEIAEIKNASAVAKSNSYNDLSNKPTTMKNPYKLKVSGLNTAIEYDGSVEKTIALDTDLTDSTSPTSIPTSKAVVELFQAVPTATSYSLQKINSKIILQGSNGTSSSVDDSDSIYDDTGIRQLIDAKADKSHTHKSEDIDSLDVSKLVGVISADHLPGGTDEILEYPTCADFPTTGKSGVIYVDKSTGDTYKWGGSAYVNISSVVSLGDGPNNAFRGDLGNIAYNHSQLTSGNPHNVTKKDLGLENVENKTSTEILSELTKENVIDALDFTPIQKDDVKLYVSTGSNSDGAMSQYATTQELNKKADANHIHSDLNSEISDLKSGLETAELNISANTSTINSHTSSISTTNENVTTLQSDVTSINSQITELLDRISELETWKQNVLNGTEKVLIES